MSQTGLESGVYDQAPWHADKHHRASKPSSLPPSLASPLCFLTNRGRPSIPSRSSSYVSCKHRLVCPYTPFAPPIHSCSSCPCLMALHRQAKASRKLTSKRELSERWAQTACRPINKATTHTPTPTHPHTHVGTFAKHACLAAFAWRAQGEAAMRTTWEARHHLLCLASSFPLLCLA